MEVEEGDIARDADFPLLLSELNTVTNEETVHYVRVGAYHKTLIETVDKMTKEGDCPISFPFS